MPFLMINSTAVQGSQKCYYGSAAIKNNNKPSIEQFIKCNSNLKSARNIRLFKVTCNDTINTKKSDCPTFLEVTESTVICSKVCWTFPFDFITICNKKPISYVLRNSLIILFSLLAVIIGICIGKNWYAIKVSCF